VRPANLGDHTGFRRLRPAAEPCGDEHQVKQRATIRRSTRQHRAKAAGERFRGRGTPHTPFAALMSIADESGCGVLLRLSAGPSCCGWELVCVIWSVGLICRRQRKALSKGLYQASHAAFLHCVYCCVLHGLGAGLVVLRCCSGRWGPSRPRYAWSILGSDMSSPIVWIVANYAVTMGTEHLR